MTTINAKSRIDGMSLVSKAQRGDIIALKDPNSGNICFIVTKEMLDELLVLEAMIFQTTKNILLMHVEELKLNSQAVDGLNRKDIFTVRQLLRRIHQDPEGLRLTIQIGEVRAQQIISALCDLGLKVSVFFPHDNQKLRAFWLGEK